MNMTAVTTIENAGKHLVKTRRLYNEVATGTALSAARSTNPEMHAFAVLSVCLARVAAVRDDGWVKQVCDTLNLPQ